MGDVDSAKLKILKVELLDESYKTHRVENGGDPDRFPVRVWFTRRLDAYERVELVNHGVEIEVLDRDPMQAILVTTSVHFKNEITTVNHELPAVAEDARRARADAEREDEHLAALVQQINLNLNPER